MASLDGLKQALGNIGGGLNRAGTAVRSGIAKAGSATKTKYQEWSKARAEKKKENMAQKQANQQVQQNNQQNNQNQQNQQKPSKLAKTAAFAGAAGLAVAGRVRRASGGFFAISGNFTWVLAIMWFFANYAHVSRNITSFSPLDPMFFFYVGLGLLMALVFYRDSETSILTRMIQFFILAVISYYFPIIITKAAESMPQFREVWVLVMFFAPLPVLYIFANPGDKITRIFASIYFIVWFIYIVGNVIVPQIADVGTVNKLLLSPAELKTAIANGIIYFRGNIGNSTTEIINSATRFVKGEIGNTTQDYYAGTVDTSQGAKAGVEITKAQPLQAKFYAGEEPIIVTATLTAKTYNDKITILNKCYLEVTTTAAGVGSAQKQYIEGTMRPLTITVDYTGEFQDQYDIECFISQDKTTNVGVGGGTVIFNSTFGFSTLGYAQYGFMESDLFLSMRRTGLNPATEMGVDTVPKVKHTPGPVMIGMSSDTQPYRYPFTVGPIFGVTLSNIWQGKGKIDEINNVSIYIPKPFLLEGCSPFVIQSNPIDWSENPAYNQYFFTNIRIKDTESFVTNRCQLEFGNTTTQERADARNYPVLSRAGASITSFFVEANYQYTLTTRTAVTIQRSANQIGTGSSGSTASSGSTGSLCSQRTTSQEAYCGDHIECDPLPCKCTYPNTQGGLCYCTWQPSHFAEKTCS